MSLISKLGRNMNVKFCLRSTPAKVLFSNWPPRMINFKKAHTCLAVRYAYIASKQKCFNLASDTAERKH